MIYPSLISKTGVLDYCLGERRVTRTHVIYIFRLICKKTCNEEDKSFESIEEYQRSKKLAEESGSYKYLGRKRDSKDRDTK